MVRATYRKDPPIGILEIGDKKYRVETTVQVSPTEKHIKLTDQGTGETIWSRYITNRG